LEIASDARPVAIGAIATVGISAGGQAAGWLVKGYHNLPALMQIIITQEQYGTSAKVEGWVQGISEAEFSPDAVMGGIHARRGWQALEDLSQRLNALSGALGQAPEFQKASPELYQQGTSIAAGAQPPGQSFAGAVGTGPSRRFCGHCGKPVVSDASFCPECGNPIQRQ
jgi:membrane protease subunit (stomatin/prohibitin family)